MALSNVWTTYVHPVDWYRYGPSPSPTRVSVVSTGPVDPAGLQNCFFFGGGAEAGSICSCGAWNIHRVNLYPVDSAISFPNTYALDTDTICSDYKKVTK